MESYFPVFSRAFFEFSVKNWVYDFANSRRSREFVKNSRNFLQKTRKKLEKSLENSEPIKWHFEWRTILFCIILVISKLPLLKICKKICKKNAAPKRNRTYNFIKEPIKLPKYPVPNSSVVAYKTGKPEVLGSNLPTAKIISKISKILF